MTQALALELAPENIRVNWISPGITRTPALVISEEQIKAVAKTIPLGRHLIAPEDVAYAALYLASEESAMVTGTGITVDGGQTC